MAPIFTRHFQGTLLWRSVITRPQFTYGASTLYGSAFNQNSASTVWVCTDPNTTSPKPFGLGFGLPYSVLDRLY